MTCHLTDKFLFFFLLFPTGNSYGKVIDAIGKKRKRKKIVKRKSNKRRRKKKKKRKKNKNLGVRWHATWHPPHPNVRSCGKISKRGIFLYTLVMAVHVWPYNI